LLALPVNTLADQGVVATGFGPSSTHIKHIVIIMMENHAFDNFYGKYCPAVGTYCMSPVNGEPAGLCVDKNPSNPSLGCVKPYFLGTAGMMTHDLAHTWNSTHAAINNGKMNGFYAAEDSGNLPFGTFGSQAIPIEWDLAEEYGLGDYFFSSVASYSLPNHWYLVAADAPPQGINLSMPNNGHATAAYKHAYLNNANSTKTVEDLLNVTPKVSWKYYDWSLPTYQKSISGGWGEIGAYNYWNPLAATAQSYESEFSRHFVNRTNFFTAAAAGTLPDISWVIPGDTFSQHPQLGNLSNGSAYIAQMIDAVEESPDWKSTAIFLTWDEYGGWYDGVAPPKTDSNDDGLGLRVPLIVISPYTPLGEVSGSFGDFESLLHMVEWQFGLGCLNSLDCSAPLPFSYFDFNQTARAPIIFPTGDAYASYPMKLQSNPTKELLCPTNCTITPDRWNNPTVAPPIIPGVDYS
ncbi:MAG: alkaline phosphatase family protein, partial [Thermoplasmata archaeon]